MSPPKNKLNSLIFSIAILVIGIAVQIWTDNYYRTSIQHTNSQDLQKNALSTQRRLTENVAAHIAAARNLQAFMLAHQPLTDYESFDRFATQLMEIYPQVLTVQYVDPDLIIRHIYPLAGNEAALNLDLTTRPAAPFVKKAIREKQMTINDPTVTVQGTLSIIPRLPLYRDNELLGLVQVVMEIDPLLKDASEKLDERFQFQLSDATGSLFWGPATLNGETESLNIPIGDKFWTLSVGWRDMPSAPDPFVPVLIWGGGGLLILSLMYTVNQTWNRIEWLEQKVAERTEDLERRVEIRTADLNQANLELQHANRAKDEFLATMSHELRTPLNSILGLSEALLEQNRDPLSDRQQRSLGIIETSGHHLLELINDILDVSKIEAGKLNIYPDAIDVNSLCRSSLAFVKEQALKKSISLDYLEDNSVSNIHADLRRMKQILVNLLTNAVKFTPKHGQVTLQVHADAENNLVQFSIIDSGIGIASVDLKRLFKPFVQVDSSLSRNYEGTGLGLALVQSLTDLHGGSVHVQSEVGVGSTFTVNLPWSRNILEQQEDTEHSDGSLHDMGAVEGQDQPRVRGTILLAEDTLSNILAVSEYLESHGFQVLVAHNGLEAIDLAGENDPDMILMDIQMPVLDGLEAIKRLRADSRFASTPIIALTALAMPGDRERCLDAGANEYLSKPVSLKSLVKTIEKLQQNI